MADGEVEKQAIESSLAWLDLLDREQYEESWETASDYFKNVISKEEWVRSLTGVRKPLGKVISRTIKTKEYTKTLPGAPDGEYVVIQYETSFENKTSAIETVTPMLAKDGEWRVSGYYIR